MQVTEAFVKAVEMGAGDIRLAVNDCISELAKEDPPGGGNLIRRVLEEKRQAADLLLGWATRAREELKLPHRA